VSSGGARLAVRGAARDAVLRALDAVLSREGYAPFDAARVPRNYPEQKREFARFAVAPPDPDGVVWLRAADWDRAFARAMHLSGELPGATVVALVTPPADRPRWKAYRAGDLVLKAGDDPDDELFYNPVLADAAATDAFLAEWSPSRTIAEPEADGDPRLYLSRRSRLYLES